MRSLLASGRATPELFRAALTGVSPRDRDAWLDRVLELEELPDDGPALPRGCAPYIPCAVDTLIAAVDYAEVCASDVFVDVGAGLGRAAVTAHLLTGASAIGLEIQPELARAASQLTKAVNTSRVSMVVGDAVELARHITIGSVFFLYCPFGGERLERLLRELEAIARTRPIRVCCVDLPLPRCEWLLPVVVPVGPLAVYKSA
jgi:SAM-dependent methyltransferase